MSKKMMKRSLALGALMAFVITGSALAAETSNVEKNFADHVTSAPSNVNVGYGTSNVIANNNIRNVTGSITKNSGNDYNVTIYTVNKEIESSSNIVNVDRGKIVLSDGTAGLLGCVNLKSAISSQADTSGSKVTSTNNKIRITNGAEIKAVEIVASYSLGKNLDASYNEVVIDDSDVEIEKAIYASKNELVQVNDESISAYVRHNTVTISGNSRVKAEGIYGNYTDSGDNSNPYETGFKNNIVVEFNKVNITENTTISDDTKAIYGAYVLGRGPGENIVSANNNKVVISGDVEIGSNTVIYGGYAKSLALTNIEKEPTINGSTVTQAFYETTGTAKTLQATATGNEVVIVGNAVVKGKVYGGYASTYETACSININASGNTITIGENADISDAELSGSYTETIGEKYTEVSGTISNDSIQEGSKQETEYGGNDNDTSAQNTSNNTLNISEDWTGGAGGKAINTVGNFDTIKIESADAGKPIKIENLNLKKDDENSNGTAIVVDKLQLGSGAQEGDSVKLFEVTGKTDGVVDTENSQATVYVGTAEMGNASLGDLANGGIDLTIEKLDMNPQVLVIGESRAAATAFVNQGSELVETGLDALARDNAKAGDTKAFAAVYGNASEYATGSHVKVNGWSGIVGVGKTNDNGLTVGAFFENGDGNYRTYNVNAGTFMRGDGEAVYNGGGLLVRKDNANGVYTEASLRAGNLKNELKNAVMGKAGLDGYDVDTFYYGAHVGIGKVIPRGNEGDSIDVYGKFMYTHHDGETFNIQGDAYKFDSVDSERLRLGFRINEVQTNKLSMYYGAAWEYEFGGDADNKVVGYDLSTPSLEGSTVIGEIGMHYLASEKWSLDLNVRGYSGQRDGFTGSVQANYNF